MQKGMNNGGRKNARYHAADDRQGEAERQLRHKDARAPIFDEDAG
jgi:transcription elongation GreA/GreB family factor